MLSQRILSGVAAAAVALSLSASLAGCSDPSASNDWRTPEAPTPRAGFEIGSLPFESFEMSPVEREKLQRGTAALLQQCLSKYNVALAFAGDYMQQVSSDPATPYVYQWAGQLGTLSMDQAQEFAYTAPPGAPWVNGNGLYLSSPVNLYPIPPTDPTVAAVAKAALLGPEEAVIATAGEDDQDLPAELMPRDKAGKLPSQGGCADDVEKEIGVPLSDLRDLHADAYELTFEHEAVKLEIKEWSECMHDAGFEFDTFAAAPAASFGAVNADQIAVATADVSCTESSQWPSTFYPVLADYQEQVIARNPDVFQSALDAERRRLDKVNSLAGE